LKFTIRLFAFSIVAAALSSFLYYIHILPGFVPFLFLFFFVFTSLFHYFSVSASKGRPQQFVGSYLATTFIRMFFYLLCIIGYLLYDKTDAFRFVLSFFMLYMIYTVIEVVSLNKALRG